MPHCVLEVTHVVHEIFLISRGRLGFVITPPLLCEKVFGIFCGFASQIPIGKKLDIVVLGCLRVFHFCHWPVLDNFIDVNELASMLLRDVVVKGRQGAAVFFLPLTFIEHV